jgi:hypothetical protein
MNWIWYQDRLKGTWYEDGEKPYHHVRWNWFRSYKIPELISELKGQFTIIMLKQPEFTGMRSERSMLDTQQIVVKADTLSAYVSPIKAVLFQKKSAPFTKKDMELREILLTLYPNSYVPGDQTREPKFQKEEEH